MVRGKLLGGLFFHLAKTTVEQSHLALPKDEKKTDGHIESRLRGA